MPYDIHSDIKYAPLEVIEAGALVDQCDQKWWNQTLCKVNDSVARIGVFDGESTSTSTIGKAVLAAPSC